MNMNIKRALFQLPLPSTELDGDAFLCGSVLRFRYSRDGVVYQSGISFGRVSATRTRAERCCSAWHIDGAYDTLVEIEDSQWVTEVRTDTQMMWRDKWMMKHYMIYLDSAGCFEIIAESWEILPEICEES